MSLHPPNGRATLAALALAVSVAAPGTGQSQGWRPWQADTLAYQAVFGFAGAAVGGVAGGVLAAPLVGGLGSKAFAPALVIMYAGTAGGMGVGVWAVGELQGADGGLGWTVLGSTAGILTGYLLADQMYDSMGDKGVIPTVALIGLSAAAIGYHVSASPAAPDPLSALLRLDGSGGLRAGLPWPSPRLCLDGRADGWQVGLVAGRF